MPVPSACPFGARWSFGLLRPGVLLCALLAAAMPAWGQDRAAAPEAVNPYFEFLMARRLEAQGDTAGALAALERAAAADPASAEVRAEIAAFHLRRGARDEAEKAARSALVNDEKNAEANRVLGLIHAAAVDAARNNQALAGEQVRLAIQYLERAAAGLPTSDANLQFMLGRLYLRNGEPGKAVDAFSRMLALNPSSLQGRQSLAQAYAESGDLAAAIGTLEEVVEYDARVAGALGQYQEQAGRLQEAIETYTRALAARPTDRDLKVRRVLALYRARDFAQAARFAADARRQHPDDLRFARLQARALFDGGDRSAGLALLEAASKAAPRDRDLQFALVDMYQSAGREPDAERVLRQILSEEPNHANALNHLGYMLAVRGDRLDEAIELVRRALAADPENGAYLDSLGWAYFKRGDLDEAEKYLSAAAERLPRNAEVQDHLGDLYARRGRWQEAIAAWTRALEGDGADVNREAIQKKIDDARRRAR